MHESTTKDKDKSKVTVLDSLFCLTQDEDTPFAVKFDLNETIYELKRAIKDKAADIPVLARHLTLWRISIDRKAITEFKQTFNEQDYTEMDPLLEANAFTIVLYSSVSLSDPGRIQRLREQFGYAPRLGGIGGTTYREEAFTNFEGVDVNSNLTCKRLATVTKLHSHLQNVRFLLVCSPPMSGKTSLAQLYENYLLNTHNELRIFRMSLVWLRREGSDWDFAQQFKDYMGCLSWDTFVHECDKVQTILIIDEIQVLYKPEGASACLFGGDKFWDTVKRVLQGGGLHIVAFASYGYWGAYSGPSYLKTISPFDLDEINAWNFEDVWYSEQEYADFFDVFCHSNLKLLPEVDVAQLAKYVKEATKCHPGLVSFVLNDIVLQFQHS
ncbi:11642_t:CDS:2 [Entrophospora sp. SA101]|nr:11642_t:CDS:2 [Entrophospora sp. SA101]CAJ0823473.1 8376_t:CDS:2 [Entrophospora sp. SA101]CAJ0838156.1 647_t:CDS:2 [Entrophospora sp. SA101]